MKTITIAGGGLAGLSLGITLRRRGVPVVLHEAGDYPRHKVCGEFMAGTTPGLTDRLGLSDILQQGVFNRSSVWFARGREVLRRSLPLPVPGISRHKLDAAMAGLFCELGGDLRVGSTRAGEPREGWVLATGRPPGEPRWIGLKAHFAGVETVADLEMHLGRGGYAGLARIEEGWVNVCGLFRARRLKKRTDAGILPDYLDACGLAGLADRLRPARQREGSGKAVARMGFSRFHSPPGILAIGDACAAIPPFTGNGMTMALESADTAVGPLTFFAEGQLEWSDTIRQTRHLLNQRFGQRLRAARVLHPLPTRLGQLPFPLMRVAGSLIPFNLLYRALH